MLSHRIYQHLKQRGIIYCLENIELFESVMDKTLIYLFLTCNYLYFPQFKLNCIVTTKSDISLFPIISETKFRYMNPLVFTFLDFYTDFRKIQVLYF